jgi:hypothetical protein
MSQLFINENNKNFSLFAKLSLKTVKMSLATDRNTYQRILEAAVLAVLTPSLQFKMFRKSFFKSFLENEVLKTRGRLRRIKWVSSREQ